MKNLLSFLPLLLFCTALAAQTTAPDTNKVEIYKTNGGELIFSFADVDVGAADVSNVLRFSGFFHVGQKWHFDFGNHFGLFTGYGIRNVGFITEDDGIDIAAYEGMIEEGDEVRVKRRSYTLGVPVGLKLGNFERNAYAYGGAELELMFNYKEKLFIDGDKEEKFNEWFSDRTNLLAPSVYGGVQFPGGINLQFKYYLLNFLNQDYTERVNGVNVQPYQNVDSRMFYLSISLNFGNNQLFKQEDKPKQKRT